MEAQKIAAKLKIPHFVIDVVEDFSKSVINNFVEEYYAGRTPNPCPICNKLIRFDKFFLESCKAASLNPVETLFATGHYAQLVKDNNRYLLKSGTDKNKDQTYMLYSLTQEELARTLFPLGKKQKKDVKELAKNISFEVYQKPESQDVCFVGDSYQSFLKDFSQKENKKGNFVNSSGKILGEHQGIAFYTIGQRRGLNISGKEPYYVLEKNIEKNEIVLGFKDEVFSSVLTVKEINWLIEKPAKKFGAAVKIRYNSAPVNAEVDPNNGKITFTEKVEAITPGQIACFYDNDILLGGGVITENIDT